MRRGLRIHRESSDDRPSGAGWDRVRSDCGAEGRDYDSIEKTCPFLFDVGADGSKAQELVEQLRWLASMGIQTVFGAVPHVDRITPVEMIGREVIPVVADL